MSWSSCDRPPFGTSRQRVSVSITINRVSVYRTSLMAVSYTHLDVYKRQIILLAEFIILDFREKIHPSKVIPLV